MKRILHMIFESPNSGSAVFRCLEVASPEEDSILLLEDAVIAVLTHAELFRSFRVFISEHDLQSRGLINHVPLEWSVINDIQWVDHTLMHHSVMRWI
jgi:sulfur relay protein TusB/DsrH